MKNTSDEKLSKLGSYTFNISNSQAAPKFAGYDKDLGNKTTINIEEGSAEQIIKENLVFTFDGEVIDWDSEDFAGFSLELVVDEYTEITTKKLRVNKVKITVPVDDGNNGTTYTYTKTITVGKTIYYQEEE